MSAATELEKKEGEMDKAKRNMVQISGWFPRKVGERIKAEMAEYREIDHRLTESRIVEDALRMYLPILRAQLLMPADRNRAER